MTATGRQLRTAMAALAVAMPVALTAPATAAPAAPTIVPTVGTCSWLRDVSALSATDAWAVGGSCVRGGAPRALTMHWNGRAWSVVKTPAVSSYGVSLNAVVALGAKNVWAVGSAGRDSRQTQRTLVLHWNGTAWSAVPTPNVGTGGNWLLDVTATSATNLWAVGRWEKPRYDGGGALAMRWNGSAWRLATLPAGTSYTLHGVDAVSATDIWATGSRTATTGKVATLSMHWNGRAWGVVPMPNVGAGKYNNFLEDSLAAVASNDVWASGTVNTGTEQRPVFRTLVLHWNGARWSVVPSPNRGQSDLYGGLDFTSRTDGWAVGSGGGKPLLQHWNGTAWSIGSSPIPSGTRSSELAAVDVVSARLAFAVGSSSVTLDTTKPLALRWTGTAWQLM